MEQFIVFLCFHQNCIDTNSEIHTYCITIIQYIKKLYYNLNIIFLGGNLVQTIKTNKNVSKRTTNLVTSALLAAIICLATGYILHIPTANGGYVHIGDAIIYLSAAVLSLPYAIACSAFCSFLSDLTTGAFIWVIPTMIIKPILVLCFSSKSDKIITIRNVIASFLAGIIGIVLYMFAEGLLFGNMAVAFTLTAAGVIQPIGSFIVFIILGIVLDKVNFKQFYAR